VTGGGSAVRLTDEIVAWIREQRRLKIRIPTIQRVARQLFAGIELTTTEIRGIK
jgi:hypothetical protein